MERYVQEQANNPDLDSFDDLYHAFLSAWDDLSRRIEQERRMDKGSIGKMRKEQGLLAYELMSLFNALPKDQTCSESFSSVVRRNHSYAETVSNLFALSQPLYFTHAQFCSDALEHREQTEGTRAILSFDCLCSRRASSLREFLFA